MAIGKKTGGKVKGSKNKKTLVFNDKVEKAHESTKEELERLCPGFNPVVFLVQVAMDIENSIEIRVVAAKEAAKYYAPQLKAIETKDTTDNEKVYRVIYEDGGSDPAQTPAHKPG